MTGPNWSAYTESGQTQPLKIAVQCGATSKSTGRPCAMAPAVGSARCRLHGGASTGPRTEQGREWSRINGSKGGRPRIHPLPPLAEISAPPAEPAPVPMLQLVKCRDCANVSAAFTCLAVKDGAGRLDMGTPHACASFQAIDIWR